MMTEYLGFEWFVPNHGTAVPTGLRPRARAGVELPTLLFSWGSLLEELFCQSKKTDRRKKKM